MSTRALIISLIHELPKAKSGEELDSPVCEINAMLMKRGGIAKRSFSP